tara:strand:- start:3519 stop:3731 length:213 start_codon:yes stop_codon:yes gene_type:complete
MSAHIMAFSKAKKAYDDIPTLTLIFEDEAIPGFNAAQEAKSIAEYMHMCLPTATIIHLAEHLTRQAKELE